MIQFDPSAPSTIARLNHHLAKNTGTCELTCQMTQKPYVVQSFGRYVLTVRPYSSFASRNSTIDDLARPDSLHLDGFEVMWGSDNLQDFENEILGLIDQQVAA